MAPSLDASDHQDDTTCLGSGIPNLTFTFHCYREGAISKLYLQSYQLGNPTRNPEGVRGVWILREEYWFHENRPTNSVLFFRLLVLVRYKLPGNLQRSGEFAKNV